MITRRSAFAIVCAACLVAPFVYLAVTRTSSAAPADAAITVDPEVLADVQSRPHIMFRHTALDAAYGTVSVVPADQPNGPRLFTPLSCERVYFAHATGLCLSADRGVVTTYAANVFDQDFRVRHSVPLSGVPSRARIAPDGSRAGFTYFVSGDSYASGSLSTRTMVVATDQAHGAVNLENFAVTRNGVPFKAVDFNFWGVTFTKQSDMFYATLASGGTMHLIEANAATRTARVIREGVECPSLSPNNRRIAFKRRMPGLRLLWRIYVLDLETGEETAAAEARSVDDQMEWLDDETLLYALPKQVRKANASMDIWAVAADGSGAPRLFIENAESPAVVRRD